MHRRTYEQDGSISQPQGFEMQPIENITHKAWSKDHQIPPGLQELSELNQVVIYPIRSPSEPYPIMYNICNSTNQKVFTAKIVSRDCDTFPALSGFSVMIENNFGSEVIYLERKPCTCFIPYGAALLCSCLTFCCVPFWCCCVCDDSCSTLTEVQSPPGTIIGYIQQKRTFWSYAFTVQDARKKSILSIRENKENPRFFEFNILSLDRKHSIGKISYLHRNVNQAGTPIHGSSVPTEVTFPEDLDVRLKALILAGSYRLG